MLERKVLARAEDEKGSTPELASGAAEAHVVFGYAVPRAVAPRPVPANARLKDFSLYLNQELSWLDFNWRVLHLALDDGRWPDRQDHVKPYREFREAFERFHIDTCGFFGHHAPLVAAMEEFPTERILFASDYPFEGRNGEELERYVATITDHTSETDAERILGGNALDLLAYT